ncbi:MULTISPECIES: tRNA (adenosine(37)-N6)-threonylcarbamoyltransferase complex transferase subunit TsaD [Campylobacter]|uniref:tRNA (adenosine(37)-N6)-threonylcarbamoyltransferase complex transferase subunit TsaD n=1 Tax=Campylobacter TaxID=194 RepID=UPI00147082FD|nr:MULTISPECIES: tRNA (adenosine(37)-N6)-threonylcarbamoyltransferase complex transferase subunit TsaD [Campylobacter]MBN7288933.1 tRNA (adenosine(37)-N6)-threonylcarbamoyltransferase complex transferase subunit TsaD [Campylobacter curvus]MDU6828238.1 tRNA (adenosine(37)-N6)-threonylcarbamoyltransferase complex transferase subunit TsaD [Campylobacter sp.]
MILGIESSCDDSSIALLDIKNLKLLYHKKISQESEHSPFGGVVPELAARLHTRALPALLEEIKPKFKDIKAIAVTNEPGLSVSLIGGVSMAKALSVALNVPLIAVNHLVGHIYSLFLDCEARFPLGVLLVSGGHTMVLDIDAVGKISLLAGTSDDSFGESFDKVAKMMRLGYPGGVAVQNLARQCKNKDRFKFTIPLLYDKRLEYSFSGLKNQVRLEIEKIKGENLVDKTDHELSNDDMADICYAFENAACAHIMDKLAKIFKEHSFKRFGIVGGASANLNLRSRIERLCLESGCELLLAPLEFCSDNAAMIARAGREKYLKGEFVKHNELNINPRVKF